MKTTFHNLITQKQKKITEGNPFSVIPIKNAKQAFNCDEIHLGSRKIEKLV
jgi:LEA14-like dessication related protein